MPLKLYNTLSKETEEFQPLEDKKVKMYTCGPTVYNFVTIGNLRAYVLADVLKRYLRLIGFEVKHVTNITDVGHLTDDADEGEDKMLKAMRREGKSAKTIARFYEEKALSDETKIGILPPEETVRASEHIKEMIDLTQVLLKKGLAYEVNGSVYFDVGKFPDYGRLSGNTLENLKDLKVGARSEVKSQTFQDKKNPADFALWLKAPPEHLLKWKSPWGEGYPGWHIECSTMSQKYLGDSIDIHTGGEDLIFPHHENEIAQSEGATEKPFVKYWIHNKFLLVDGEKMSKSVENIITLDDIIKKGFAPLDLRMLYLTTHYRQTLDFTWKKMKAVRQARLSLNEFILDLQRVVKKAKAENRVQSLTGFIEDKHRQFIMFMSSDLNTPLALDALFQMVHLCEAALHKDQLDPRDAQAILDLLNDFNRALAIFDFHQDKNITPEIKKLLAERDQARKAKDFEHADTLRDQLAGLKIKVEDSPQGQTWYSLK